VVKPIPTLALPLRGGSLALTPKPFAGEGGGEGLPDIFAELRPEIDAARRPGRFLSEVCLSSFAGESMLQQTPISSHLFLYADPVSADIQGGRVMRMRITRFLE
jgi:hypothetical protein